MFGSLAKSCLITTLVLAACDESTTRTDTLEGNARLGISQFRVTEAYPELHIVGVDADGQEIAWVDLRVGHVDLPEEGIAGVGREMSVRVAGLEPALHQSVGLLPLELPLLVDAQLGGLLSDASVSGVLEGWGIRFAERRRATGDLDYGHEGSCDAFVPPCGGTQWTGCCLEEAKGEYDDRRQTVICGNSGNGGTFTDRKCKAPFAQTSCGGTGPAGCVNCWSPVLSPATSVSTAYDSGSDTCNWACYADADGDGFGAGDPAFGTSCGGGWVYNNRDCYDGNANAKPGQTTMYSTHRGDGSFDYNCDGQETKATQQLWAQTCWGDGDQCHYDGDWVDGPACGATTILSTCNDYFSEPNCFTDQMESGVQYCR